MKIINPTRVRRTYTQKLVARLPRVFELLCPVRETEWFEGWEPDIIYSQSGAAESDCIFTSEADSRHSIWYTTRREPENGFIELIEIIPDVTACRLSIRMAESENGSEATLTYLYTSLGSDGDAFITSFSEQYFEQSMKDWEERINYFLTFGRKQSS